LYYRVYVNILGYQKIIMYTWALKENNKWEYYTWSFHAFRSWKKNFLQKYKETYWETFNQTFPNKEVKEAIFKDLLWFDWSTDVFQSGRIHSIRDFDLDEDVLVHIWEVKKLSEKVY